MIAVIAHPAARLGGLLARPPLVWLGLRSYSFYLWHWPVLALTRPGLDVSLPRGVLIPLQLLAVLALADLSYRFVELPFRGKRKLPAIPDDWLRVGRPRSLFAVVAIVLLVGWGGISRAAATISSRRRRRLDRGIRQGDGQARRPRPADRGRRHRAGNPPRIVAFGDSVMIGAKEKLAARFGRRFSMNAKVGRQANEFVDLARR